MFTKATPSPSLNDEISEICPLPKELTIGKLEGHREQTRTRDRHCPHPAGSAAPGCLQGAEDCNVRRAYGQGHSEKNCKRLVEV